MKNQTLPLLISSFAVLSTGISAGVVTVPGTSDPWLAGQPNGTPASGNDIAPGQSPVLYPGAIVGGVAYSFSVSGAVNNGPGWPMPGPDGGGVLWHATGPENGIADLSAPINSLIGVFLSNAQPVPPAPGPLDFSPPGSLSFTSLAPALNQPFFIGDGLTGTGSGSIQQFFAPPGATRLFLGTMDGYEWNNNLGSFEAIVVPEPGTYAMAAGLALAGWACWRRRTVA